MFGLDLKSSPVSVDADQGENIKKQNKKMKYKKRGNLRKRVNQKKNRKQK